MTKIKYHPVPTFKRLYKSDQRAELTWPDDLQENFLKDGAPGDEDRDDHRAQHRTARQ
jgi:hypothetical protein